MDPRGGRRAGSGEETPRGRPLRPPLPLCGAAAYYKESSINARGGRKAGSGEEAPRGRPPRPSLPLRGVL